MIVVGFDLGGTDLKATLLRDGVEAAFTRVSSRVADGPEEPFRAMDEVLAALEVAPDVLDAIGLGCPGVIDPERGMLRGATAHLPHWRDEPLRERLEHRYARPIAVDNDANAAALAEYARGAGRAARAMVLVTLGSGIGCGMVLGGRVHRGAWGGAGEIGHMPLGLGSLACRCGVPQCVEPEASASGLVRAATAIGLEVANAGDVFALALVGEPRAVPLVARFIDRLGATLASVLAVLNPDVLLIGGGISNAGETLLEPLRASVARYALPSLFEGLRIERAGLGERAGAVGAALMAEELAIRRR